MTACRIGFDALCIGLPSQLHRTRLDWQQSNAFTVATFTVYRVEEGSSVAEPVGTRNGATFTLVDTKELPDFSVSPNVTFTYFVVATFVELDEMGNPLESGPSNFVSIEPVNDPPLANADLESDAYVAFIGAPLMVAAADGVLANDMLSADSALPTELMAVTLVDALTSGGGGTVTLAADGSFTFTPAGVTGLTTFMYKAYEFGPDWEPGRRLSPDSVNSTTVTIDVVGLVVVPVRNLPPRRQNTGSAVPVDWHFALQPNGVAVDSRNANPTVSLVSATEGISLSFSADDIDPGGSSFKLPTAPDFEWQINLQLAFPDPYLAAPELAGMDLPAATDYRITIDSDLMEQPRPFVSDEFEIRATKGGKK